MPRLTVATFNVRYGTADDGPNHWDRRRDLAADAARGLAADVLGLQECLPFQLDHFRRALPGYGAVGVGRDDGRPAGGEMVPVLWRADRLELIDAGHFWLAPEPHLPGARAWGAGHPRMVTWAALRTADPPRAVFTVLNTHLDRKSADARAESAALIRRRVAALGPAMPVVVTGDFNATEADPPYALLRRDRLTAGDGLTDAYRAAHPGPGPEDGTYHEFTGRREGPRIDWVLASPHWRVTACRIDHTSRGGLFPSDHYPVVAELALAGG